MMRRFAAMRTPDLAVSFGRRLSAPASERGDPGFARSILTSQILRIAGLYGLDDSIQCACNEDIGDNNITILSCAKCAMLNVRNIPTATRFCFEP